MATLWNSSTNSTSYPSSGNTSPPPPRISRIAEGTSLVIVIFTSLVLNFSVGFIIWQHKNLRRRTTNVFILNLVISNALMSIFVMPISFYALLQQGWTLGGILCKVNGISSTTLFVASIYTLCFISFDRYYAVVRPMRYKHVLTARRALCVLLGIWAGALLCACVPLFGFSQYELHTGNYHCSPSMKNGCGFYMFMSIVGFILPVAILLLTYGMIFSKLRRHAQRVSTWSKSDTKRPTSLSVINNGIEKLDVASSEAPKRLSFAADEPSIGSEIPRSRTVSCGEEPNDGRRNILELVPYPEMDTSSSPSIHLGMLFRLQNRVRTLKRSRLLSHEYKIAKTGFALVVVFFFSWGPYMMVNNCKIRKIAPLWVFRTAMWLAYFSCVLNPIAYALYSRNIRAAFSRKFNCCRISKKPSNVTMADKRL